MVFGMILKCSSSGISQPQGNEKEHSMISIFGGVQLFDGSINDEQHSMIDANIV